MRIPREVWWIAGLTLAAMLLAFLMGGQEAEDDEEQGLSSSASTYSHGSGGLRGLYVTLERLGYDVRRSRLPISSETQPRGSRGTLVIASPSFPLTQDEWTALREWLAQGNRLLLLEGFGLPVPELVRREQPAQIRPVQPNFLTRQVGQLAVRWPDRLKLSARPKEEAQTRRGGLSEERELTPEAEAFLSAAVPVFGDEKGAVVAYAAMGKGDAVYVSEVWPLTNAGIREANNLEFVLNALGARENRTISFDEYHHGYGTSVLWNLIPLPAKLGLAQVLLGLLFIIYARSRRFGPIVPVLRGSRERSEFLGTMTTLLAKGSATRLAVKTAYEAALERLRTELGLPAESDAAAVQRAVAKLNPEAGEKLAGVLAECRRALSDRERPSETRAAELVRRLDAVGAEVRKT